MHTTATSQLKENLSFLVDSTLKSYSVVFFGQRNSTGLLLLLATFVEPVKGLYGLLALLTANAIAMLLGYERRSIRKGYYGFNALLVGLALSYFYAPTPNLLVLTLLSSFLATLLSTTLQSLFSYYLRLPSLSLPFVFAFSIAMAATVGFGKLELAHTDLLIHPPDLGLPVVELFLKSLGSVLFQVNVVSGGLVLLALLLYSRIAVLLSVVGLATGYFTHDLLGALPQVLTEQYLGFNYVLTAIALGGLFLVPSEKSLLVAVVSVAASAIIMIGSKIILPAYLPPTAIPFNIITLLVLYGLKVRFVPSKGLLLSSSEATSPEENLSIHRANLKTFRRWGVELSLPFHGNWVVTQGFNGTLTHKEEWRYGVDFMIRDGREKSYKGAGTKPEEYYCYNVPVLAPAEGKVVMVKNDVPDNPIGKVNERDNWGNVLIVEHAYQFYSCMAHLKKGSISVKEGDRVHAGQPVARCGNSGRSPFPHLHVQMQAVPQLGAPTVYFQFSNFLKHADSRKEFVLRDEVAERDVLSKITPPAGYLEFFPYSFTQDFVHQVRLEKEYTERWSTEIDLYGNLMMKSAPVETRMYFTLADGVLSVKKLEGSRQTGLYHAGELFPDTPLVTGERLQWESEEESDYPLPSFLAWTFDLFRIVGIAFKFRLENTLESTSSSIKLRSAVQLVIKTPIGTFAPSNKKGLRQYTFAKNLGLTHFVAEGVELQLLEMEPRQRNEDEA